MSDEALDNSQEPLTLNGSLRMSGAWEPLFLRKVARVSRWDKGDLERAMNVFKDPEGEPSLWKVGNDTELRRVAIALNEGRNSLREPLQLLPIHQGDLEAAGITHIDQTSGERRCVAADSLHYVAKMTTKTIEKLCRHLLFVKKRQLGRCTKGQMRKALVLSIEEGCFSVAEESTNCKCGAAR